MIPNEHALMIYKFGEKRWIEKIKDGELSFSCGGAFISQAKKTGNVIQGDLREGVFARLLNTNPKILEMKEKLGSDLEIVPDGDYSLLRRRSAKFKPIYCAYAYTAGDAIKNKTGKKLGKQKVKFEFDSRMYEGFSGMIDSNVVNDPNRFALLFLQPKPFIDRIEGALNQKKLTYKMSRVKYIDMTSEEFFIELTDNYDELFHKSIEYEYQHEVRICLTGLKFKSVYARYPLIIFRLTNQDFELMHSKICVEFGVDFSEAVGEWEGGI